MGDIYYRKQSLERFQLQLSRDERVTAADRVAILEFLAEARVRGLSASRIYKYAYTLNYVARDFPGPVTEATEAGVREFVRRIEEQPLADWTKRDRKLVLKLFLRWWRKTEPEYPPEVRWLRVRFRHRDSKLPHDLLTSDEVARMVRAADNPRDRAMVALLYESGMRIGELLTMHVGSVRPTPHGAEITISDQPGCKTGGRRLLVVASAPQLFDWISAHPRGNDPQAPLWIALYTVSKGNALYYMSAHRIIRDLARRAGIEKRVHPHLFRHSRASRVANKFTEAQMNAYFGWVQGSGMPRVYVHLSGRDMDSAVLGLYGIRDGARDDRGDARPECPRCRSPVLPTVVSCPTCWLPLMAAAGVVEERPKPATEMAIALVERLLDNPKFAELLAEEKARAEREGRPPQPQWPRQGPNRAA